MTEKTHIIVIENSFLIRSGMEHLLSELPGIRLTKVFDGTEKHLTDKINHLAPDFIILNPEAPAEPLHSFLQNIERDIVIIGLIDDHTPDAIRSKFSFTIHVRDSKFELLNTLNKIPGIHFADAKNASNGQLLSKREITILKHITLGMTNQEIAEKLFLSFHTVTTHRKNITKKLGIKTVSGLTVYAILNNIIHVNDIKK